MTGKALRRNGEQRSWEHNADRWPEAKDDHDPAAYRQRTTATVKLAAVGPDYRCPFGPLLGSCHPHCNRAAICPVAHDHPRRRSADGEGAGVVTRARCAGRDREVRCRGTVGRREAQKARGRNRITGNLSVRSRPLAPPQHHPRIAIAGDIRPGSGDQRPSFKSAWTTDSAECCMPLMFTSQGLLLR